MLHHRKTPPTVRLGRPGSQARNRRRWRGCERWRERTLRILLWKNLRATPRPGPEGSVRRTRQKGPHPPAGTRAPCAVTVSRSPSPPSRVVWRHLVEPCKKVSGTRIPAGCRSGVTNARNTPSGSNSRVK